MLRNDVETPRKGGRGPGKGTAESGKTPKSPLSAVLTTRSCTIDVPESLRGDTFGQMHRLRASFWDQGAVRTPPSSVTFGFGKGDLTAPE